MAYDKEKDPAVGTQGNRDQFGGLSRDVTPDGGDVHLNPYARGVVAGSAGNLVIVPVQNEDNEPVTFLEVPVGFVPPFRVRTVKAETTCTAFTIEDRQ